MNLHPRSIRRTLAAIIAISGLSASAFAQGSFYGLTYFDNQLISIDATTGTGSLVGTLDMNVNGYGLANRGSQLLTFDPNVDEIRQIDPTTATISNTYNIGVSNTLGEGDLTFRADGTGFLASSLNASDFSVANDLYRFDITTGTSILLAHTPVTLNGLAFIGNTLYGLSKDENPDLYIIDQSTGNLSLVGSLGVNVGSPIAALATGPSGGLFGVLNDRLYSIDSSTGAAAPVDADVLDTSFFSVSGLAPILNGPSGPSAVPEPSTYAAFGALGLLLLTAFRQFRRSKAE